MKYQKWQIPITLVLFISGILLVTALRALAASNATPLHQKNEKLVAMIKTQEAEIKILENNIEAKRASLDRFQRDVSLGKKELEKLQKQLQELKTLSGMTEVEGPGLTITLDDNIKEYEAAQNKNPGLKPDDYLIHDKHILYIVNELRVGGAEAISVNDQRIVNSSDIRCVGPLILVNTTRLGPPYVIKAIGNPDNLARILALPESEYNILKMAGYPVKYEKSARLVIPPFKGSYQFTYARPKEE